MARPKNKEIVEKEPPQLYCMKCRQWKSSMEKDPFLPEVEGQKRCCWICPQCRGDAAPPSAEDLKSQDEAKEKRTKSGNQHLAEAKYGPQRSIIKVLRETGKSTRRVELSCGHEVTALKSMKTPRCFKCKPKPERSEGEARRTRGAENEAGMEAKYGPKRAIAEVIEQRKSSKKAKLSCGHIVTLSNTVKEPRCSKCKPDAETKPVKSKKAKKEKANGGREHQGKGVARRKRKDG